MVSGGTNGTLNVAVGHAAGGGGVYAAARGVAAALNFPVIKK
jgi:hypothetical protein